MTSSFIFSFLFSLLFFSLVLFVYLFICLFVCFRGRGCFFVSLFRFPNQCRSTCQKILLSNSPPPTASVPTQGRGMVGGGGGEVGEDRVEVGEGGGR